MRKYQKRHHQSNRKFSLDSYFQGTSNGLNSIRGLLASVVCVSHVGWFYGQDNLQLRSLGVYSVAIFFGISGFLIHQSAFKSKGLTSFATKRVRRIFPAYILVLCATSLLYYPVYKYVSQGDFTSLFTTDQILYILRNSSLHTFMPELGNNLPMTGTQEWNPSLWTLEYEFILYFLCYFLSKLFKNFMKFLAPVMMISSAVIANLLPQSNPIFESFYLAQFFFLGMTLWQYRRSIYVSFRTIAMLTLGVAFSYSVLEVFSITSALLVLLFLAIGHELHPKRLRNVDYSYGIYLHAGPITHLVVVVIKKAQIPLLAGYVLSLIFSIAAGFLSWHLVESRFSNRESISKSKI